MDGDSQTILTAAGGDAGEIRKKLDSIELPSGWTFRRGTELHRQPELAAGRPVLVLYSSPLDDSFSANGAARDAIAAGAAQARIHHIGFQWRQTSFTTEDVAGWWAAAKVPLAMQYAVKRAAQAIATEAGGLTLDIAPSGRNGTATVTARQAGDTLACESFNLTKAKQRADFARAVCDGRDGIDRAAIEGELLKVAADLAARGNGGGDGDAQPAGEPDYWESTPVAAKEAGQAMLESAGLVKQVADDVAALGVAGEREMVVTLYLVGTSRLLTRPLSAIVQGPSSSGKSYLIEKTAALFPPEAVIRATSMTPQALFYMAEGALEHRWVVAGERSRQQDDDATEATRALREMQSAGRLSKLLPIKRDGVIESVLVEREGPIAFVESTTLAESAIFDEDRNRALLLNTDEQTIQTRRIIDRLAEGYSGAGKAAVESIIGRHHAAQRILERGPREVVIPFARRLGELITPERVEARRAFPQLCSMIQASALLHAKQREADDEGRLIAAADDYKLCRHLLLGPLGRLLGGHLSAPAARFLERLRGRFTEAETFTKREAAAGDSASKSAAYGWLSELADADAIELVEPSRGRQPGTWRLATGPAADAVLPAVEKVFPV